MQLETYTDQSAEEMRLIVSNYAGGAESADHEQTQQEALLTRHNAFVCVLMSHGTSDGRLYGRDGADFHVWRDLLQPMNGCAALHDKPKCYILLGCQVSIAFWLVHLSSTEA